MVIGLDNNVYKCICADTHGVARVGADGTYNVQI